MTPKKKINDQDGTHLEVIQALYSSSHCLQKPLDWRLPTQ